MTNELTALVERLRTLHKNPRSGIGVVQQTTRDVIANELEAVIAKMCDVRLEDCDPCGDGECDAHGFWAGYSEGMRMGKFTKAE